MLQQQLIAEKEKLKVCQFSVSAFFSFLIILIIMWDNAVETNGRIF